MTTVCRRLAFVALLAIAWSPSQPIAAQLGPVGTQFWSAASPDLATSPQAESFLGSALAAGDFDCDGFDDLAVGVPDDDDNNGALADVGFVLVVYGGDSGLAPDDHQLWDQQSLAAETEEADDRFGSVLATGDFDDDGCLDLAIGAPDEDIGVETDAGGVQIIYGSPLGLVTDGNVYFRQGAGGISAAPEAFDAFGSSLAAGDFDDDGFADLAIGVPGEDIEADAANDAGAVHVLFGSASGLTGTDDLVLFRGSELPGTPRANERIGAALAAGQFGGFGPGEDLAIGAPGSDGVGNDIDQEGLVFVYRDVGAGLIVGQYTQSFPGVPGASEEFDHFGQALAAGDFDGDGFDEIVVGAPGEDLEGDGVTNAGAVTVLDVVDGIYSLLLQNEFPFEQPEDVDEFGTTLATGDFDADGVDDLAIGVPLEDLGPVTTTGIVHVVYGQAGTGLDLSTAENWLQTIDPPDIGDRFGLALAAGRFAGHSGADLAIGAPGETVASEGNAGAWNVVYSEALFLDGFETNAHCDWSSSAGAPTC
jgi:hypothetical protein